MASSGTIKKLIWNAIDKSEFGNAKALQNDPDYAKLKKEKLSNDDIHWLAESLTLNKCYEEAIFWYQKSLSRTLTPPR